MGSIPMIVRANCGIVQSGVLGLGLPELACRLLLHFPDENQIKTN